MILNLLDLIFPKKCLYCDKDKKYICDECISKVEKGSIDAINQRYSYFKYQGVIRKAIIKLKYNFSTDIVDEIVDICTKKGTTIPKFYNAVLVPVPLSRKRKNWRGFNQSSVLGKKITSKNDWIFEENLLVRIKNTTPQAHLNREKRLRNIRGNFAVNGMLVEKYINRQIIIFDDVITTGSTISECRKVLQDSGFKKVVSLSICS